MKKIDQLLNNESVMKVSNSAAQSFRGVLSNDEINTCIINAIWKASEKFDESKSNCKFTTYVHKGVVFECLSQRKFNLNHNTPHRSVKSLDRLVASGLVSSGVISKGGRHPGVSWPGFESVDMIDEMSDKCDDPQLIYDRFYKNMTIKELAKARGVCGETIRIRLKKNLKKLKLSLENY